MIFGLKRKRGYSEPVDTDDEALAIVGDDADAAGSDEAGSEPDDEETAEVQEFSAGVAAHEDAEEAAYEDAEIDGAVDHRADGPFDIDEVDLTHDGVERVDLGALVVTPWDGLGLQLHVNEATKKVQAVTAIWQSSGLEVALFAAPATGGLAEELREDIIEEAEQAGGSAEVVNGSFGAEVRRVLPQEGPAGEQFFHVSRIWFAEGPRWLLRATLLGEAALGDVDDPKAAPFVEFFRNLVVRRGTKPMVPGELLGMDLPQGNEG